MADDDMVVPNDDASVDLDDDDTATSALVEQKVGIWEGSWRTLRRFQQRLSPTDTPYSRRRQEGETVDLTKDKDGGVMKTLLKKGKGYKRPEAGDEVFGASDLRIIRGRSHRMTCA